MEWTKGDIARVVSEPYYDSPACWIPEMDDACGYEVEITYTQWREKGNGEMWQLVQCKPLDPNMDLRPFNWNFCADCFVQVEPDFEIATEVDMGDLFGLR